MDNSNQQNQALWHFMLGLIHGPNKTGLWKHCQVSPTATLRSAPSNGSHAIATQISKTPSLWQDAQSGLIWPEVGQSRQSREPLPKRFPIAAILEPWACLLATFARGNPNLEIPSFWQKYKKLVGWVGGLLASSKVCQSFGRAQNTGGGRPQQSVESN